MSNDNILETLVDAMIGTSKLFGRCVLDTVSLGFDKDSRRYDWEYFFKEVGLVKNKQVPIYQDFRKEEYYNIYIFKVPLGLTVEEFKGVEDNISYFVNVEAKDIRLEQIQNKVYLRIRNNIPMNFEYEPIKIRGFNVPIGVDVNTNRVIYHDLISSSNCHMLLGGSTGSGKSYLLKLILCNLIYSKGLRDLQLVLINTKYTDLKVFKDCKQVVDYVEGIKDTIGVLEDTVEEIERRYKVISNANCDDIKQYRDEVKYMPYRFVILEEFSSYHKTIEGKINNKFYNLVEEVVARGRACGILLITTMQLSASELVPSHIKNNINTTLGGKCKDKHKSITLCGEEGLERLKGNGQFKLYDSKSDGVEFQSYLVKKDILNEIVEQNKRAVKGATSTTQDNKNTDK